MTDETTGESGLLSAGLRTGLAQDLYQALADWDRVRLADLLHPDFVGHAADGLPLRLGGSYHGPQEMISQLWGGIGRNFIISVAPAEFCELPDGRLIVTGRYLGTARASGGALDAAFVHTLSFRDGRIIGLTQLTDTARWEAALAGPRVSAETPAGPAQPPPARPAPAQPAPAQPAPVTARTVSFEVTGGLATVRLDRPDARNAIDLQLVSDLADAVQHCAADPSIRAVLLCASGPAFTVGGDVSLFGRTAPADLPGELRRWTTSYHASLRILDGLKVPVVAAVQGAVAGGGLGLMNMADIVLAAEGTKFATGFASLGLSGDGGSTWFLPRLAGSRRAAELYFSERVLDASEALDWGLISRVVPAGQLQAEAGHTARGLAAGPTKALGEIRALLRGSSGASLGDQLQRETEALSRTAGTQDAPAAIKSFLAKSHPEFRGC